MSVLTYIGVSFEALSPTKLTVPLAAGGVNAEAVGGDNAGAVYAVVDAAAVTGESQNLFQCIRVGRVDNLDRTQFKS